MVMIEAMACGTPVIAFPKGSVREVINTTAAFTRMSIPLGDYRRGGAGGRKASRLEPRLVPADVQRSADSGRRELVCLPCCPRTAPLAVLPWRWRFKNGVKEAFRTGRAILHSGVVGLAARARPGPEARRHFRSVRSLHYVLTGTRVVVTRTPRAPVFYLPLKLKFANGRPLMLSSTVRRDNAFRRI